MEHCRFRQQEMAEYALLGPPHPGEVLREVIWPRLNLTRKLAAQRMGIPLSALSNLLNERRRVSRSLAVELARITGTKAVFWLVLQAHYDAWVLESGPVITMPERKGRLAVSRLSQPFGVSAMTPMS